MKKKIIVIAGIIVILVVVGMLWKSGLKAKEEAGFELVRLERGDVENTVSSTGTLSAVETVEVGSQVSGNIEKLFVDFNDSVHKGQVLAVLDKTLFQAAVQDAEASVSRAKARLDQANAELNRDRPLFEKGHLSETEFLVTKTTATTALADFKTAEAALKRAQTNLGYTVIRSPIDGTIIERTVDAGQTIAASFQAPKLFIIAKDLTRMQIEANVDESDIGQIKEDQSARFEVQAYPDLTFTGKVRQVRLQPTTIQNVVNYTVVVDASNDKGLLLPGMTATVDFLVEERRDVLLVPNTALNFKLSEDLMKKYGEQMKKKMMAKQGDSKATSRQTGFPGIPGMGGGMMGRGLGRSLGTRSMTNRKLPEDMGMVYYLDEQGIPTMALLKKGATDGKMTEIVNSRDLKEGMEVITAYTTGKTTKTTKEKSSLFPPPPGPGGPH